MRPDREFAKKQDIIGWLQLAKQVIENNQFKGVEGTGPHKVKLISCEEAKQTNKQTGQEEKGVMYVFEENEAKKKYFVPFLNKAGDPHYLIMRLSEFEIDDEFILEYKKKEKGVGGYIDVSVALPEGGKMLSAEDVDDIPVIDPDNDDEVTPDDINAELSSKNKW